jgi:uncharacterized protein (DUF4415 family)
MKENRTKKARFNPVPPDVQAEVDALLAKPNRKIRTDLIPEARGTHGWRRGIMYAGNFRPIKKQLTLRVDADIITWFREHAPKGQGYQTSMNIALRDYVERQPTR